MLATRLSRHYDTLTPAERLPLLLAAATRSDDEDVHQLARSTHVTTLTIPDYVALAQGLEHLARGYMLRQLERVALYWRATGLLAREPLPRLYSPEAEKRLQKAADQLARRVARSVDAWRLFCEHLHVDPETSFRGLPGCEPVCQLDELARLAGSTPESANPATEVTAKDHSSVERRAQANADCQRESARDKALHLRALRQNKVAVWSQSKCSHPGGPLNAVGRSRYTNSVRMESAGSEQRLASYREAATIFDRRFARGRLTDWTNTALLLPRTMGRHG